MRAPSRSHLSDVKAHPGRTPPARPAPIPGDRGVPRRTLASRRHARGRDRPRRRTVHRAGRVRRLPDRFAPAGAVALRRRVRPTRRRAAATRAEGSRNRRSTWTLKDELIRRGKVYYAKLARGKAMFIAPRMIPHFHAVWGVRRSEETQRLSARARAILKVLRSEWEMSIVGSPRGIRRDAIAPRSHVRSTSSRRR